MEWEQWEFVEAVHDQVNPTKQGLKKALEPKKKWQEQLVVEQESEEELGDQ